MVLCRFGDAEMLRLVWVGAATSDIRSAFDRKYEIVRRPREAAAAPAPDPTILAISTAAVAS